MGGSDKQTTWKKAWDHAYAADPISIFGGIIVLNRPVDVKTAEKMHALLRDHIAPRFWACCPRSFGSKKKNLRLLELDFSAKDETPAFETVSVMGGLLVQEQDMTLENLADWTVVTKSAN